MQTECAARTWIEGWLRAWPASDTDAVASLYAEIASYRSHPFRVSETARAYVTRAFAEESFVAAWFGEPIVAGDRAAVEYWAVLRDDSEDVTIAGTAVLRFGGDGKVVDHRDYWDRRPGRTAPPQGWGR